MGGAMGELPELAALGVTVLEVMPVADFPGRFGWGYDGVNLFAPTRLYGGPDDFRRFVDRAHALGLGVILDVVYNHFGPDGNYLRQFSEDYFTDRYTNEWGEAINFDGANVGPGARVLPRQRRLLDRRVSPRRAAARRDAADLRRLGRPHPGGDHAARARGSAAGAATIVVAENEPPGDAGSCGRPGAAATGWTALWNDDFHHSAMVALTGRNEAYYTDYRRHARRSSSRRAKWGYLYQGQHYTWQRQRRGTPELRHSPRRAS